MQKIKKFKSFAIATIMSFVLALGCVGAIANKNVKTVLADDEEQYLCVDGKLSVTWQVNQPNVGLNGRYGIFLHSEEMDLTQGTAWLQYSGISKVNTDKGEIDLLAVEETDTPKTMIMYFDLAAFDNLNPTEITIPAGTRWNATASYQGEYAGIEFKENMVISYIEGGNDLGIEWEVVDRKAPVITWTEGDEIELEEGYDASTITATATDDKDGAIECTYTWSDGTLDADGCLLRGTHTLTIKAIDAAGNEATKEITVVVTGEDVPETPNESSSSSNTGEPESSSSSIADSGSSSNGGEQSSSSSCKGSTSVSIVLIVSLVAVVCFVIKSKKQTR